MSNQVKLDRLLKTGEVLLFNEENFGGKQQLYTQDAATLAPGFTALSLQLGPRTGVTLCSGENFGGTQQDISADLPALAKTKLQGRPPKSLKIWSNVGRPFRGSWAIEVTAGLYLSLPAAAAGVLGVSRTVSGSELFQVSDEGKLRPAAGAAAPGPVKPAPAGTQPLTIADLQQFTLLVEPAAGRRKYSLQSADDRWVAYDSAAQQFHITLESKEKHIFGLALKIAADESQVGEIEPGEVALYEQPGYWGRVWVFHTDYADFACIPGLDEAVSSIQPGPGTAATLYRQAQFRADDPQAGKQDIIDNVASLKDEQVGDDAISSIRIWRMAAAKNYGVSYTCCLSQDFRTVKDKDKDKFEEYSAYRTTLHLPPEAHSLKVWATDETTIEVDGVTYTVDEDHCQELQANALHCVIITTDAMAPSKSDERPGSLSAPALKIRTDTMWDPNERIVIYPDRQVHTRLAKLQGDALWNASYTKKDGTQVKLVRDRSASKKQDVANAQEMIAKVMSTIQYSRNADGGWEQTISTEALGGKSWALDFLTYKVTASTLYVRQGPGMSFKPEGYLRHADVVKVLEFSKDSSWLRIRRIVDGLTGWCSSAYLDQLVEPPRGEPYCVTAQGLHLREGPGVESRTLRYLVRDETVTVFGANSARTWLQVACSDGLTGWAYARFLTPTQPAPTPLHALPILLQPAPLAPQALAAAGPQPGYTNLVPQATFHEISQAEVQAMLAVAVSPDSQLASGLLDWIADGISLVITTVKKGVAVLVQLAEGVVGWIVDTAQKVATFVKAIFEKIVGFIEDVIKWLRYLLEWDDILKTRDYLRKIVRNSLHSIRDNFIPQAKGQVSGFADKAEDWINDLFDKAIRSLGVTPASRQDEQASGEDSGGMPDPVEWIISKVFGALSAANPLSYASVGKVDTAALALDGARLDFIYNELRDGLKDLGELQQGLADVFVLLAKSPGSPYLALAKLLEVVRHQLIDLVEFGERIALGILDLVAYLVEKIEKILETPMRIPFISDLIDWFGGSGDLGFSLLDVITLILAIPVTILSKAFFHQAPFAVAPQLALAQPTKTDLVLSGLSSICDLMCGLVSLPLDLMPETDPSGKADAKNLTLVSFAELFTWLCSLASWALSWHGFLFEGEDQDASEIVLFSFETTLLGLDVVSFFIGFFHNGKLERLKRLEPWSIWISTVLGGVHIVLVVWSCIEDREDVAGFSLSLLPLLPEIYAPLRIKTQEWKIVAILALNAVTIYSSFASLIIDANDFARISS